MGFGEWLQSLKPTFNHIFKFWNPVEQAWLIHLKIIFIYLVLGFCRVPEFIHCLKWAILAPLRPDSCLMSQSHRLVCDRPENLQSQRRNVYSLISWQLVAGNQIEIYSTTPATQGWRPVLVCHWMKLVAKGCQQSLASYLGNSQSSLTSGGHWLVSRPAWIGSEVVLSI